jgi:hypothetical protein
VLFSLARVVNPRVDQYQTLAFVLHERCFRQRMATAAGGVGAPNFERTSFHERNSRARQSGQRAQMHRGDGPFFNITFPMLL